MSTVTDQTGMQDGGTNAGDFDDDEGGGLVILICSCLYEVLFFLSKLPCSGPYFSYGPILHLI